jgi:metallo-beta-lactamase family protein
MLTELYSWGAAEEVTGSKHFLKIDDQIIQIDCGAFQGRRKESEEKNRLWPFNAEEVTALILTHAHYDHCGLVPLMPKNKYLCHISNQGPGKSDYDGFRTHSDKRP